jgi:hypothetical protein
MLVKYDFGLAFIFQQSKGSEDIVLGVIQYVGILKQNLKLDYGPIFSPILLFCCSWVENGIDNKSKCTYKQVDVSFLFDFFFTYVA